MSSVVILGDVHLGKSQTFGKNTVGSQINSKLHDQLNLLDWTLEQAIEENCSHIIITGDIFEEPKPLPSIIAHFISWLKKCQVHNLQVHIIVGNHDVLRTGFVYSSPLDIIAETELENVFVYKDINTILIGSSAFTFMPFRDRKSLGTNSNSHAIDLLKDSLTYELASIPVTYKKIVVGHLALEGSIPIGDEIDDISNELFCPFSMFEVYDYVWMGHVHKPQIMKKSPHIAHVGSMDVSNFGESDHKIIVIFDCNNTLPPVTKQLPTRSLKKFNILIPKDTADSTQYVISQLEQSKTDFNKSIVKLEVSLSDIEQGSIDKSQIEKYLLDQGAFNIANILESKKIAVIKKDNNNSIDTKMDIASAIKTYCNTYIEEENKQRFIELAMEIVGAYKTEVKE